MKRFIPTIILVLVCIGAFWYASSQSFFKKEVEQTTKPLVTVKKEDITGVKIKTATDSIELQTKDGTKWSMTKPSALPVNDFEADSWASAFVGASQEGEVDANPADLSGFGLQTPAQEFEATLKDGSTKTIQIGNPLPISGYYYVKLKDAPNVYKIGEQAVQSLVKAPIDFMQKQPISISYNDVQSVSVSWNGNLKTLTKSDATKTATDSDWKLGSKDLKGTDATPVLDKILLLTTEQLAKPASEIKLDNPEFKLELKLKKDGKDSTDVYIGKAVGDDVWLAKQGDSWAYAISKTVIQEMSDALQ